MEKNASRTNLFAQINKKNLLVAVFIIFFILIKAVLFFPKFAKTNSNSFDIAKELGNGHCNTSVAKRSLSASCADKDRSVDSIAAALRFVMCVANLSSPTNQRFTTVV